PLAATLAVSLAATAVTAQVKDQPPKTAPPAATPAAASTGPYVVLKTFEVGGEGGWDYLTIDSEARRLYVPRGTHTMVLDADKGTVVGDIADTSGVHGVAIAGGKGFTSNGKTDNVTVFDTKTLK